MKLTTQQIATEIKTLETQSKNAQDEIRERVALRLNSPWTDEDAQFVKIRNDTIHFIAKSYSDLFE